MVKNSSQRNLGVADCVGTDAESRIIREVDPFCCRIWHMHDRLSDYVTEQSCRAEIESVRRHGQLVPALGRPVHADPRCQVEIVYGARRLFVAQHLNVPLRVELRNMSDRDALVAMDAENRDRKDVSAYERGMSYARWLRGGYFETQEELARVLKVSASQVSRLLKLAQLPSVIVCAFKSPLDIREEWGIVLYQNWQDPNLSTLVAQRARAIAALSPRPAAQEVYSRLIALAGALKRPRTAKRDIVVTGSNGLPLYRIRFRRSTIALIFQASTLSDEHLGRFRQALSDLLKQG